MAVFLSAVDRGSFTAAARHHGISPTMVAKHVTALEKRLDARLLHRTTRSLSLTDVGRVFAERCRRLLADLANVEASASAVSVLPTGRLRISAPVALGTQRITPLLAAYLTAYPDVEAELVLGDRKVDLAEEGFDCAFRIGPLEDDWLVAHPLPPYRLMLAAAPDYLEDRGSPAVPADLTRHSLLGFTQWQSDRLWTLIGPDGEHRVTLPPQRLRINHGDALREAAVAGFGIILQSVVTLEDDLAAGCLQPVLPDYAPAPHPLHLVRLPDRRLPASLRAFLEMSRAWMAERPW